MRFEKWQALGNDYLVVECHPPAEPLAAQAVRDLCDRHRGVGADGVLELRPPDAPGTVARLRIVNPDGSEAELSGNGARQAVLYLRRHGWTTASEFAISTAAGEVRPVILSDTSARVAMGTAGIEDARLAVRGFTGAHLRIGNPQTPLALATPAEVEGIDLAAHGPAIERAPRFPHRTNVSFWAPYPDRPGRIRARIWERGVGETQSSGTGACGAAVAAVLAGGASPVTVVLDGGELLVDVDDQLGVQLTGWAVPVFAGELIADPRATATTPASCDDQAVVVGQPRLLDRGKKGGG